MKPRQKWSANGRPCGSPVVTGADQKVQLQRFLYECRPHMLDAATVDSLCQRYGKVARKEVEYLLTIARQNRAGEVR